VPALDRVGTEDGAGDLGAAGADQAGEAQDLALADLEADVVEDHGVWVARVAGTAQALHLEGGGTLGVAAAAGEKAVDLASDHHADDSVDGDRRHLGRASEPSVTQHGDTVADRQHLVEPVGNEDDGDPPLLQVTDNGEEAADLGLGEGGSGLVHDDELGLHREGAGDLHHLLLGDGQGGDRAGGIKVKTHLLGDRAGRPPHRRSVDEAQAGGLAADEDVLRYRQRRDEVELLVDGDDAQRLGLVRACGCDLASVEADRAGVGRLGTGQDLQERGLAGPILAQQRHHLAREDLEGHVGQRLHAGKALGDPGHAEERRHAAQLLPESQAITSAALWSGGKTG
jgi:hypothetical protein